MLNAEGAQPKIHPANSRSSSFPMQMFIEHLLREMPVRSAGEKGGGTEAGLAPRTARGTVGSVSSGGEV